MLSEHIVCKTCNERWFALVTGTFPIGSTLIPIKVFHTLFQVLTTTLIRSSQAWSVVCVWVVRDGNHHQNLYHPCLSTLFLIFLISHIRDHPSNFCLNHHHGWQVGRGGVKGQVGWMYRAKLVHQTCNCLYNIFGWILNTTVCSTLCTFGWILWRNI